MKCAYSAVSSGGRTVMVANRERIVKIEGELELIKERLAKIESIFNAMVLRDKPLESGILDCITE